MRPFVRSTSDTSRVLPAVNDMYVYMDADHPTSTSTGFTCLATGDTWTRQGGASSAPATTSSLRGQYFDCRSSIFNRSGGDFTLTTGDMTIATLTRVNSSTSTWRTLVRGAGGDHHVIISSGGTDIGMYDNDGGGFQDSGGNSSSGWDTTWQILVWQFSNSYPFYVFYSDKYWAGAYSIESSYATLSRGFANIGGYQGGTYGSQFWGDFAVFACWNRKLSYQESFRVHEILEKRIV